MFIKIKPFNCRGSRWNYISKSTLGNNYISIKRDVSQSMLKRFGCVVSAIDIEIKELPTQIKNTIIELNI